MRFGARPLLQSTGCHRKRPQLAAQQNSLATEGRCMNQLILRLCVILMLFATAGVAGASSCRVPNVLHLAVIPQTKDQTSTGVYDSLVNALADELKTTVVLIPADSYGAVIEGMINGTVDLAELGTG